MEVGGVCIYSMHAKRERPQVGVVVEWWTRVVFQFRSKERERETTDTIDNL
jgi:hypothetical protein